MNEPAHLETGGTEEFPIAFLLKEYETLRILRQDYIALGDSRFNFFLVILSGAGLFITWINSQEPANLSQEIVSAVTAVIGLGVLLLGLTTFVRITHRNSRIVIYTRGMARIRGYFVDHNPDIAQYMISPTSDDRPAFGSFSTGAQLPIMLGILNGLIAGTGLSLLFFDKSLGAAISIGLGVFVVVFGAQLMYYDLHMKKRRRSYQAKFLPPGDL